MTARTVSEELRSFTAEMPWERESILDFVVAVADATPEGTEVLDVGAGDAPYRELFGHARYRTVDWSESLHPRASSSDIVASAEAIPLPDASIDLVLLTQVLEHVPDPKPVLAEQLRLLRPGGRLALTAPLVWELHELPHDYFRYTGPGLERLLATAGFEAVDVRPRNDCFTTLAQLVQNVAFAMGRAPDGRDGQREEAMSGLQALASSLARLTPLDVNWIFPLGYAATASRPAR